MSATARVTGQSRDSASGSEWSQGKGVCGDRAAGETNSAYGMHSENPNSSTQTERPVRLLYVSHPEATPVEIA